MYQSPIILATYEAGDVLGEAETSGSGMATSAAGRASVGFSI